MSENVKKLITLSPEVDEMLKQHAQEEHRTVTNLIEHIILKYFGK